MATSQSGSGSKASNGVVADLDDSRQKNSGRKFQLQFTNSSASLFQEHTTSTTRRFMASRAAAALQLHRTRLQGISHRLALCFLLGLALILAWLIGYFNASPALLVLLGVASVAIGIGRWQQVVEGAELEAELRARQKSRSQIVGETVEWLNVALHKWWNTCNDTVLLFMKDHVQSLVKDVLPSTIDQIEVVSVDLGGQTPSLSNVRLQDAPASLDLVSDTTTSMVVFFDITIPAPEAQIVLRAKVGGKSLSSSHNAFIESLYVNGTIQAMLQFDNQLPFPHLSKITATFVSRPDIWFSVRVLKGLRVMDIPLLKNWIHSLVMDTFTTLLVNPGKLTINLDPNQELGQDSKVTNATLNKAVGVVTVAVKSQPPTGSSVKDMSQGRSVTLRVGSKKYEWPLEMGACQKTYAFLVHDLSQEVLVLKVKQRRMLYGTTLAVHSTSLASLGLVTDTGEAAENRVVNYGSSECQFSLDISYTVLPAVSLHKTASPPPPLLPQQRCGVLYVQVHEGTGLQAADSNGLSDPYCVVMANKQKILRTDYVAGTLFPVWESAVEVLVADLEQVVLMFAVFDYDGPMVGDDFLGAAKLPLSLTTPALLRHSLPLKKVAGADNPSSSDKSLGSISVSVMFRPVASVGEASPACHVTCMSIETREEAAAVIESDSGGRHRSQNWTGRKKTKKQGKHCIPALKENDEEGYIQPVMEVEVIKGRDLVPKDSNGLSDPYVVIKYGSQVMFRSKVIKKTLNPHWGESITLTAPDTDDIIHVECWDKDVFSDDYMGSMTFTYSDITSTFTGKPSWCKLQHVKHGELLLYLSLPHESGRSQEEEPSEEVKWSHLDEASRQLVGEVELREDQAMGGAIIMRNGSGLDEREEEEDSCSNSSSSVQSSSVRGSSSEAAMSQTSSNTGMASNGSAALFSPGKNSISSVELTKPPVLKRRHTLGHHRNTSTPMEIFKKYEENTDPSHLPRYPETTADIKWALLQGSGEVGVAGVGRTTGLERTSFKEKLHTVYHNLSGQVVEASGLKGNLDHMELYVKIRLNTRPSYQRQQKFARGPVVHKTRNLRGSNNPQWMEDFVVKESPVPSDSLLTLDLKSGSKVNIGTYAITLDKFFEGQLKSTRTFDIGNDMKLKVKMSRQLSVGK